MDGEDFAAKLWRIEYAELSTDQLSQTKANSAASAKIALIGPEVEQASGSEAAKE